MEINYKEHPLWLELDKKLEERKKEKKKTNIFDNLIMEYKPGETIKVL